MPPSPVGGTLPLELALPDDVPPDDTLPDELPLDPEDGTMLEPEPEDAGDPSTTITFSPGAAEHATNRATTQLVPKLTGALMPGKCRAVPRNRQCAGVRHPGDAPHRNAAMAYAVPRWPAR
jgi:hypothetical protein